MPDYPPQDSVRTARARYFTDNGFPPDGGYTARWVKLKLGPLPFWFPNTKGRVRAVRLHDLHHVATGYETNLIGEAEIGAWELAGGCENHLAAWVLNLMAVGIGLVLSPRRVARAFSRGRRSRTLYSGQFSESLLDETVGQLRTKLGLDSV